MISFDVDELAGLFCIATNRNAKGLHSQRTMSNVKSFYKKEAQFYAALLYLCLCRIKKPHILNTPSFYIRAGKMFC